MTAGLEARRRDPLTADVALALGLTALSFVPVVAGARDIGSLEPVSVALLFLQTLPLAVRQRAPLVVFVMTATATILHASMAGDSLSTSLGALFALYTLADLRERRVSAPAAVVLGAGFVGIVAIKAGIPESLGSIVQTQLAVWVSWLLGTWARERRAYIGTVEERATRAEREREERAERAVEQERVRIARELHDVVTHHVSVIVIQAGAAARALGRRPADAAESIQAIDAAGRQALTDMRRMLGILAPSGGVEGTAGGPDDERLEPMPGLDRLGRLLETVRAAGLPVELTVTGERRPLDPGIDLSAYRIVQEALTNVMKHAAGARTTVAVRYLPDAVELTIEDEGAGGAGDAEPPPGHGGPGRGVIGMRERVAMLGGHFEAGSTGRGFRVHASLPTRAVSPVVA
jgi:signal transduction histidine kinase